MATPDGSGATSGPMLGTLPSTLLDMSASGRRGLGFRVVFVAAASVAVAGVADGEEDEYIGVWSSTLR